jgi:hypothetical protein
MNRPCTESREECQSDEATEIDFDSRPTEPCIYVWSAPRERRPIVRVTADLGSADRSKGG